MGGGEDFFSDPPPSFYIFRLDPPTSLHNYALDPPPYILFMVFGSIFNIKILCKTPLPPLTNYRLDPPLPPCIFT